MAHSIAVTGASGFIGRTFVERIGASGHRVRAVSRRSIPCPGANETVTVATDSDDASVWMPAVRGVDVVVHLAGRAHVIRERSQDPIAEFRRVNVALTLALARAAADAGVRRFVFVSSIGVLGERTLPGAPWTQSSSASPTAAYAISKLEAERALQSLSEASGFELVIVRPPLVHGPGAPGNFARLLGLVERGWPLPFGGLHNRRSFVGVANLAAFLEGCAIIPRVGSLPLLPADEVAVSTTDLLRWIAEDLGVASRLFRVPGLASLTGLPLVGRVLGKLVDSLEVDSTSSWAQLGLRPTVGLRDGVREMSLHHRNAIRSR